MPARFRKLTIRVTPEDAAFLERVEARCGGHIDAATWAGVILHLAIPTSPEIVRIAMENAINAK
jgi:hypothetical protein